MTRFFEHQARARRNTRVLIGLMLLSVLVMGGSLYLAYFLSGAQGVMALSAEMHGRVPHDPWQIFAVFVLGTALVVAIASTLRMRALRGDGARIAEMLGGRLVSGQPHDDLDKRLLNVVEEMAIAAGMPVPRVFVLDAEPGINALAAGRSIDDGVVAVTRGALDKLTREELQGVVAHEISHILNGDSLLNVRLMGVVFGILCLGLFGRLVVRAATRDPFASRQRDRTGAALLLVGGIGIIAVGLIGELCGKLIKAAVSRQRELLADASATQLTRNPHGLAAALAKIGGRGPGARIAAAAAEEASHFFFGEINVNLLVPEWFATHPPLRERITRLDPSFAGDFPEVGPDIAEPIAGGVVALSASFRSGFAVGAPSPSEVVAEVGTIPTDAQAASRRTLQGLPERLREAADNPFSACATVCALLLSEQRAVCTQQLELITAGGAPSLAHEALRLLPSVRALARRDRLPLCALLTPSLQALSHNQCSAFTKLVQRLVEADRSISIFEYVLIHTLQERLRPQLPGRKQRRHKTLFAVRAELELVLCLLAHAGGEARNAAAAFAAAASRLPELQLTLRAPTPKLLSALGPALIELRALAPVHAERVIDACAHAAWADQGVSDNEWTLLQAICGALGCPLPASISGAQR